MGVWGLASAKGGALVLMGRFWYGYISREEKVGIWDLILSLWFAIFVMEYYNLEERNQDHFSIELATLLGVWVEVWVNFLFVVLKM